MALTRYRLTSSTTAPAVTPTIQSYSHDQGSRRQLLTSDSSALTSSAYTPDAADHSVAGDAHHIQFVSNALSAGIVYLTGNTLQACIQGFEPNANCNQTLQIFVSVVNSSGVQQAVLRSKQSDGTELATALTARFMSTTLDGSYTTAANDRLVVEFSTVGTPAGGGGVQGHNATLRWGSDGASGDLAAADGETGTTFNPWVEIEDTQPQNLAGVLFQKAPTFPTGVVSQIQPLTGTLFTKAPTYPQGAVTSTYALTGTLFQKAPTFPQGVVTVSAYTNLVVVELEDAGPPDNDLNHYLRANARTNAGTGFIRIRLFQNTTEIAGFEFEPTGTFTTYSYALLEAEAATITDYNDLQIHIDIKATATPFTPEVDWVDLQRPASALNLAGVLFQKAPTFNVGTLTATRNLDGVLFTKAPTFFVGDVGQALNGVLFQKVPTFFAGAVTSTYNLVGVLYQNTPTFSVGAVTSTRNLDGVLFQKAPTFPAGAITTGAVNLAGVLFQKAPAFFAAVVGQEGGPQLLGGTLFQKAPTFPTGTITTGVVNLAGVLFQKAPTFNTGAVSATYALNGVLFQKAATFPVGTVIFDQVLGGVLFQKAPTFPQGLVALAGSLDGVLFVNAPVFFTGTLGQSGGSFWRPSPAGYTLNPVGYTVNPAAYDPVLAGDLPPWAIEVDGEVFVKAPLFPVGSVS